MKKILILLFLLLAFRVEAATYGVANESCTTTGTVLTSTGGWQATLAAATPGTTYLLRNTTGSTFTASGSITVSATNVTIKPYDCQAITVVGQWLMNGTPDGLTIAGLTLNGTNLTAAINSTTNGTDDVTIRNNVLMGGNNSAVRIRHSMARLRIEGNDIDNVDGQAGCTTAAVDVAGTTSGVTYRDFTLTGNKIQDHVCEQPLQFNLWSGTATITNNYFPGTGTLGNGLDIKSPSETGSTLLLKNNLLLDRPSDTGANVLIHGNTPLGTWFANTTCIVEGNYIEDSFRVLRIGEGSTEPGGPCVFKNNIFVATTNGAEVLRVVNVNAGNTFDGNIFYNGVFQIDTESSANIIRNNIFHAMTFSIAAADYSSCTQNDFFNPTTPITSCANNSSADPQFVNTGTRDWNSQQTSLVNDGTTDSPFNGSARDIAIEVPVIASCEVGLVSASIIVCDWSNNVYPPLSTADNTKFSAKVATVARTINSTVIVGDNQTQHTLASAVTNGQAVVISCTYGCVQDTANIGGPELALHMKAKAFTDLSVTNNVGAGGGTFAVDATTNCQQDADADPWACSHTTGASANLIVALIFSGGSSNNIINSVTFNGDAMTEAAYLDHSTAAPNVAIYYRVNPDQSTTGDVSIDWSGTIDGGVVVRSYNGADTTTPLLNTSTAQTGSSTTSSSMNISCPAGNQALSVLGVGGIRTITVGDTSIMNADDGTNSYAMSSADGAGTNTMDFIWTGGNQNAAQAVTCVKAGDFTAPTHVVTQSHFRFHWLTGTESNPTRHGGTDSNVTLPMGAAFRLRIKFSCQTADCPPINPRLYKSYNSAPYEALTDSYVNGLKMYGTTGVSAIPDHLTPTTEQLTSDETTNVACAIIRTGASIPNIDLSQDSETECEWVLKHDGTGAIGDTSDFEIYDDQGSPITTAGQTPLRPRLTIGPYVAGRGL